MFKDLLAWPSLLIFTPYPHLPAPIELMSRTVVIIVISHLFAHTHYDNRQELSYRKQIARQLRTNTSMAFIVTT